MNIKGGCPIVRVFAYFNIECGQGKTSLVKQIFNITSMKDNECIPRRGDGMSKSVIVDLIKVQSTLREELEAMAVVVELKDAEISTLQKSNMVEMSEGTGSFEKLKDESLELYDKVNSLEAKVEVLIAKIDDLTQQLLQANAIISEHITLLLHKLFQAPPRSIPKPVPSFTSRLAWSP